MGEVICKEALVQIVSERTDESQAVVRRILKGLMETIRSELSNRNQVVLRNFGRFYTVHKLERRARNPRTGESVVVPSRWVVKFKPSKNLV